jgi:rubrerythrin
MRTSKQWWNEVKNNPKALIPWLKDQYHGEVTAARRIKSLAKALPAGTDKACLDLIALQEAKHALWVSKLLKSRGIKPQVLKKKSRYWEQTLPKDYQSLPLKEIAAIGAHAEKMRLARIKVIAHDQSAPEDIRQVFAAILPDEKFHEQAFRALAGSKALKQASQAHQNGLNALGLVA